MSIPRTVALPPGCLTDPSRRLTFMFDDQPITALAGQSIAAALYGAGVRIFTRSFKYHRPRGLFCVAGDCPNCLMQVDGRPNVRTCIEPVRAGQVVRHQNAWPSLDFDVLHVFDKIDRVLPVGFYYKHFHRPRWLWPVFEHTVRHIAGLGTIDVEASLEANASIEYLHTDICVVGGGPAGLAAAMVAAGAGASVLLLDQQPCLKGHLLYAGQEVSEVDALAAGLASHPRVQILSGTTAFGLYEGHLLGAFAGDRFLKIRARHIILCTGGRERPFVFHNNDLPGIFLGRGVQRLARLHGVRAGRRAVVVTDDDAGHRLAEDLAGLGIETAAVVDQRPLGSSAGEGNNWLTLSASVLVRAFGTAGLQGVEVASGYLGSARATTRRSIDCDLLCVASALTPANELVLQGRKEAGVSVAGAAAGTVALETQIVEGRLRGAEAAAALGFAVDLGPFQQPWAACQAPVMIPMAPSCMGNPSWGRKRFVCLCEDVTEKDLQQAVAEGFDHIETLKRYSTATMGPCQGKVCSQAMIEVCARATGRELAMVGTTTSRPPATPVELAVLAAGRFHPVRRTPLHHWHETAGATWLDAGVWKRPESYGDPLAEVRAVRTRVGLIDVSTLGKIEVVGPDAAELLERVYLNKWRDLAIGRVRYGVMCNEDGILLDDGVGACLAPDRFYLTATTGNAEAVVQWLELWAATGGLNVQVLNHTSALAAMNLAGPRAREVLGQRTALDLSSLAFPYLAHREAEIAGVACRLLRIGFVGELGYEIHCASAYAWHLWTALYEAGLGLGLKAFGVEAQRILRLEKGHLIIGQDTDALSNPLEAGLEWMVRFDKPRFHGREPLRRLKEMGPRSHLVGFFMANRMQVPSEGCQVVENGRPVGRVTSARYSPTLERSFGLAWVPRAKAAVGETFHIRWNGADVPAMVAPTPFYDPEGKRLKA
jgi:sarcosine oxidase subunit alpha